MAVEVICTMWPIHISPQLGKETMRPHPYLRDDWKSVANGEERVIVFNGAATDGCLCLAILSTMHTYVTNSKLSG